MERSHEVNILDQVDNEPRETKIYRKGLLRETPQESDRRTYQGCKGHREAPQGRVTEKEGKIKKEWEHYEEITHAPKERVKELNCLQQINGLLIVENSIDVFEGAMNPMQVYCGS